MGAARRAHHAKEKALRVIGSKRAEEAMMKAKGKKLIKAAEEQFYQPEVSYLESLLGDTDFGIRQAQAPKSPALGLKIALGGKVLPKVPEGVNVLQPGEFPAPKGPEGPSYEESIAKLAGKTQKPDEAYLKSIKEAHYKNIAKMSGLEYEPFTPPTPAATTTTTGTVTGTPVTTAQQQFPTLTGKDLEAAKTSYFKNAAKLSGLEYEPSTPSQGSPPLTGAKLSQAKEAYFKNAAMMMGLEYEPSPEPITGPILTMTPAEQKAAKDAYLMSQANVYGLPTY